MAKLEMCLRIRFLFAAWNIGFTFGAAKLAKGCGIETKLSYEKLRRLRWQRVSSDV